MRSEKRRLIALKDPQLRKIRTELRNLLRQAFEDHYNQFFEEMKVIHFDKTLSDEEKASREQALYRESEALKFAYTHSVIGCRLCGKRDLDLIYNPVLNRWYCEGCYEFNRKCSENLYP